MTLSVKGLTKLILTHFRNYEFTSIKCDTRPVVLTGINGVGKTNILEAISFLSPGRGLRRAKLGDIKRFSQGHFSHMPWGVATTLSTPDQSYDIGTGLDIQDGKEKRVVKINGEFLKSQTLLSDYLQVLWLTPQMDRLFQEGGSTRRRFLDRLVYGLDPVHATRVARYEYFMRERSRLLKFGSYDTQWIETLESRMALEGIAITVARLQFIERLKLAKAWRLGAFPQATLNLIGEIESFLQNASALEAEDSFKSKLKMGRRQDQEAATCTIGPHRSNLIVIYKNKNCEAAFCSTGEQKALLISIIFAAAHLQSLQGTGVPIILLDEVIAHLDQTHREALFEEILALKMQAWMTGTDSEVFSFFKNNVQHFCLQNAMMPSQVA